MRAVLLERLGGPERLTLAELDDPLPAPDEILIRVAAAGVNFADVLIRRGDYPQPPELPAILGNEVAGEVLVGDAAGRFVPGERVAALAIGGGGYAELAAAPAATAFALPPGVPDLAGATLLMAGATAWLALRDVGAGDTVLVHAAGGGVGGAAVQLARARGARVVATASSDARLALAIEQGAELAIDRRERDFVAAAREHTGGAGVDLVVDPLGGELLTRGLAALRPLGRLVAIGEAAGRWPDLPVARLVGRNVGIDGIYVGRLARHAPDALREAGEAVVALAAEGSLAPRVGAVRSFEEAAAAHALVESGAHAGKVALVPAAGP